MLQGFWGLPYTLKKGLERLQRLQAEQGPGAGGRKAPRATDKAKAHGSRCQEGYRA